MSICSRPPCLRRNSPPTLSASLPRRAPRRCLAPPHRRAFSDRSLRARFSASTRCSHKWDDYDHDYDFEEVDADVAQDEYGTGMNLEAEILEFMSNSSKPEAFPNRKELVEAGRSDLAEAIVEKGGWLSLGWEEEEEEEDEDIGREMVVDKYHVSGEEQIQDRSSHKSFLDLMEQSAEMGIEGILNRLEKQRNLAFGFEDTLTLSENGNADREQDQSHHIVSTDTTVSGFFRISSSTSVRPMKSISDDSEGNNIDPLQDSHKPEISRSWTIQRSGLSQIDSQDIGVAPSEASIENEIINTTKEEEVRLEPNSASAHKEQDRLGLQREDITHKQLQNRLQHLELHLSLVLRSVRSNGDEIMLDKDHENLSEDLQKVYDSWEFRENEIMKAQDQLKSTRAKLAVLEGKMALAIIEAQNIIEERQKRIDDARRALRLVNSTCIVWPNPASEVLLAGSFDGWVNLRKMEKLSIGIFSLWLQLYPGRYEIKFVVDGEWRTDPQRPIVNNNGHFNNLLIIS